MGLDTYLLSKQDNENWTNLEPSRIGYWRKCWGINNWLKRHSEDLTRNFLIDIADKMGRYIDKLLARVNELGGYCSDAEDLRLYVCELDDDDAELEMLNKIIKSFNFGDLVYSSFADSIWGAVLTFITTYQQLIKLLQDSRNTEEFAFVESY